MRMRRDLDIFSSPVKEHIFNVDQIKNGIDANILNEKDTISNKLIPIEVIATKSKESDKNMTNYLLMCKDNLKFYNDLQEYINDVFSIRKNTKKLNNDIDLLTNLSFNTFSEVPFDDIVNSNAPF